MFQSLVEPDTGTHGANQARLSVSTEPRQTAETKSTDTLLNEHIARRCHELQAVVPNIDCFGATPVCRHRY